MKGLENENEEWVKGEEELMEITLKYFKELFSSKPTKSYEHLLAEIQPCIPNAMNEELSTDFKEEELVEALKTMAPLKASSKDGFPTFFYHRF